MDDGPDDTTWDLDENGHPEMDPNRRWIMWLRYTGSPIPVVKSDIEHFK